jgi:hypothetical protein
MIRNSIVLKDSLFVELDERVAAVSRNATTMVSEVSGRAVVMPRGLSLGHF